MHWFMLTFYYKELPWRKLGEHVFAILNRGALENNGGSLTTRHNLQSICTVIMYLFLKQTETVILAGFQLSRIFVR